MKLYSYYRSSAAFRVRIALALKHIDCDIVPVHLTQNGGEQKSKAYRDINPQQLVPALQLDDGTVITQSLAIMEYLDAAYPAHVSLLPGDDVKKANIRAFCQIIACDIHPLDNLRVLQYLQNTLSVTDQQKAIWYQHWIIQGFEAIEQLLSDDTAFCFGDAPTMADCCLIPQIFNAKRYDTDLTMFTKIMRIFENCMALPAFQHAAPERQLDAPTNALKITPTGLIN